MHVFLLNKCRIITFFCFIFSLFPLDPEFNLPNTTISGPQCYSLCHIRSSKEINEFYCPRSANWNCSQVNSSLVTSCHTIETLGTLREDGQLGTTTTADDFLSSPSQGLSTRNGSSLLSAANSTSGSASRTPLNLFLLPVSGYWPSCLSPLFVPLLLPIVGHFLLTTIIPSPGFLILQHQHVSVVLSLLLPWFIASWLFPPEIASHIHDVQVSDTAR